MATLKICSMDDQLYEALKRRAREENRSISEEAIAILKDYLSRPTSATQALLDLAGSWEDDRGAEEIIEDIRQSRYTRRFQER